MDHVGVRESAREPQPEVRCVHFPFIVQKPSFEEKMEYVICHQLIHQGSQGLVLSHLGIGVGKDDKLFNCQESAIDEEQNGEESQPVDLLSMVDNKINFVSVFHVSLVQPPHLTSN